MTLLASFCKGRSKLSHHSLPSLQKTWASGMFPGLLEEDRPREEKGIAEQTNQLLRFQPHPPHSS